MDRYDENKDGKIGLKELSKCVGFLFFYNFKFISITLRTRAMKTKLTSFHLRCIMYYTHLRMGWDDYSQRGA